jgi:L(+)-tartrate dehydratase beta subunit
MAEHRLTFPTTEEEIRKLRAGDLVTVDGHIIGIRDRTQIRIFDQGVQPPIDLSGAFLLHTAPNVRKVAEGAARGADTQEARASPATPSETTGRHAGTADQAASKNKYEPMCVGTTTSARMVRFTEPLGRDHGVRAICGKGGLPDEAIEPMRRHGMAYFAIVGGAAALETTQIEEIEAVYWEELMPECLWKFRVKDFGPLWVGIDSHGNSLFHDVQAAATKRLEDLVAGL